MDLNSKQDIFKSREGRKFRKAMKSRHKRFSDTTRNERKLRKKGKNVEGKTLRRK